MKCRFHPGLDTKNCFKKQIAPFISVFCVYLSMLMCVCVLVIEYVVCVFFLLLFGFFIQGTSFLVFAIYLFNV